jgi:hypothetical protein
VAAQRKQVWQRSVLGRQVAAVLTQAPSIMCDTFEPPPPPPVCDNEAARRETNEASTPLRPPQERRSAPALFQKLIAKWCRAVWSSPRAQLTLTSRFQQRTFYSCGCHGLQRQTSVAKLEMARSQPQMHKGCWVWSVVLPRNSSPQALTKLAAKP